MLNDLKMVTFQLGTENFGIDINSVQEIIKIPDITKIPRTPAYVKGIANLRGEIFPVIDTRLRFNMEPVTITKSTRLIVVYHSGQRTGLIVDRLSEVVKMNEKEVFEPPSLTKGISQEYIRGVINLSSGHNEYLIMVINLDSFCRIQIIEEEQYEIFREQQKTEAEKYDEEHLISFFLSDGEYAIKISSVKEIIRFIEVVKIPNTPPYVKGLIYHRNILLPVIDLRSKFNLRINEKTELTRIIIIDLQNFLIGLIVDSVKGILRIPKATIEPPPHLINETESKELLGIVNIESGNRLIMMIDLERIISYEDLKKLEESRDENRLLIEESITSAASTSGEFYVSEENYIVFRLEKEEFAINIRQVQEVNKMQELTRLPNAPVFVNGVLNLRGDIIPVVSLRKRFNLKELEKTEENFYNARVIVINVLEKKAGLIVDGVSELLRVNKSDINPIPEVIKSSISTEYMNGIIKIKNSNRMLIIIDLEKILKDEEKRELVRLNENFEIKETGIKDKIKIFNEDLENIMIQEPPEIEPTSKPESEKMEIPESKETEQEAKDDKAVTKKKLKRAR